MPCVTESMLRTTPGRAGATPDWLSAGDHAWLRVLVDEHLRFLGRPRRELDARLREPLPCFAPRPRLLLAREVLARMFRGETKSVIAPRVARESAFLAGAEHADRDAALGAAAARSRVTPAALDAALFADLPGERIVALKGELPSLSELVLRANLLLAQSLLHRAFWAASAANPRVAREICASRNSPRSSNSPRPSGTGSPKE